ncbi:DUF2569 family protein [Escherichia coli]|uniref:DUF2569 domain-containing protein n=1 Tax=Escherichia coli TaxID=562 RepID=A0A5B9SU05_ECOLX|nr:DUF2569 family protein [Escherichia coli]MCT6241895.1 DUF2569 family protein [Escherichia coli]MCW9894451.1 DUF2569 family protein [Escherichia coli]MCW9899782.1 DUF2569 family protein [Escherichia coli]MCW9978188.1 DUF2569 family protein [Escherichia coli]MDI1067523.1 DUF2569 family protein [Escherichia coli]
MMKENAEMLQKEKRPKFSIVLFIILLSVVHIFITRLSLAGTFYSLYMSLHEGSQVKEYFIISIGVFIILSVLCMYFILSFFRRKRHVNRLLLYIYLIYIVYYAVSYVYCFYVVGGDYTPDGSIENIFIDGVIAVLFILYIYLSKRAKSIFIH